MALDFKAMMAQERKAALRMSQDFVLPSAGRTRFDPLAHMLPHSEHEEMKHVWHMRDWISPDEEAELLRCVDESPSERWTPLAGRRLQSLGGLPTSTSAMQPQELPAWVASVSTALVDAGVFDAACPPNHVLLNEYQPGQGIDLHRDGPQYMPRVAILSLGSACGFDFSRDTSAASLLLPSRGLLVFSGPAYEECLHGVPAVHVDQAPCLRLDLPQPITDAPMNRRTRRVSLTIRRVLNVSARTATVASDGLRPAW